MAATNPNEFEVWQLETPVVSMVVDLEFDAWDDVNGPDEDVDESFNPTPVAVTRRRVMIF